MALRLRTRLFLVVAVLLGASIGVSALLSRRATLVEVRSVVQRQGPVADATPVLMRVAALIAEAQWDDLDRGLGIIEADTTRRIVVVDSARTVVAASSAALRRARIQELTLDGTVKAEIGTGNGVSIVDIRGAPMRRVPAPDGRELIAVVLPLPNDEAPVPAPRGTPLWVWTTMATGLIAVPLVFAVARRILGPISALTDAAYRMRAGDLGVRVGVQGDDEVASLAQAFNDLAARLAENERLRKQMVSDVAHELRSPVTNLRCTLESIQDGLAAADRPAIDALHEETLFLQRLISDLEELSRADAGQLRLRVEPVDVGEAVRRAAAAMVPGGGGVALRLEIAEALPLIPGDADRLEQVFRNLLANAVRHTPAGGCVTVSAGRHEAGGVRVEVTDTGCGIDAAHLPKVFDRFYRADESRARSTGGAGLGLAIVRQLVTAHGGEVTAESAGPGQGTTFVVTLPGE